MPARQVAARRKDERERARQNALAELQEAQREVLRASARIEAARREVQLALDAQRNVRTALRHAIRGARDGDATFAQIAAVLQVSVQRAHSLSVKDPEVKRR